MTSRGGYIQNAQQGAYRARLVRYTCWMHILDRLLGTKSCHTFYSMGAAADQGGGFGGFADRLPSDKALSRQCKRAYWNPPRLAIELRPPIPLDPL
jgi:hypothetical protein